MEATTMDIPLNDSDEVIELQLNNLPKYNEILYILQCEKTKLQLWVDLALEYYKKGNAEAFVKLLESSRIHANIEYENSNLDQMKALDMLAAYNVQIAKTEKDINKRNELLTKATLLYATGDKIIMYDTNHLLGHAFLCLLEGDKMEQANLQFNFVLNKSLNNMPAQLGKACISFHNNDYNTALYYCRKVLSTCPQCPVNVRVGMAHCFLKLGNMEKAQLAFERTLNLDPSCVNAMVGLSIMKLNSQTDDNIKSAVNMLSKAYTIDSTNPMVLNHLSNHFFFKKDYVNSELLARFALQYTDNDVIKSESCYQMARIFHIQENYEQAFQYYYQSTQFASKTFVLPYFGLGQVYLQKKNIDNAIKCFEKVIKVYPENHESLKILGSLYGKSNQQQKQFVAKNYLKKAVRLDSYDTELLIEYAQLLEQSNIQESLNEYNKALNVMHDSQREIPPELLNNIAALNYRLGNFEESCSKLEESLSIINRRKSDFQYYNHIEVTTSYNLARIFEIQHQFQKAETLHKNILKEHPNYIDSFIRLGCMARDRNQIYEASEWFKDALQIDNNNSNVWILLGNLHLSKQEFGPAQKKFERILKNPSTKHDSYSLVGLGNIWLQQLYYPSKTEAQKKRHEELSLRIFSQALSKDPKNIWAANGIGCILAYLNHINEAKNIFFQVREATMDFCDVWLNIAHIYVKQKQYNNAIQMYESCRQRFFKYDNIEVLQYLGNAYCKARKFKEAKAVFLKAHRVAPQDLVVIYNLAYVLKEIAVQVFKNETSKLKDVLKSVQGLELAYKYFQTLSTQNGHYVKYDVHMALLEAQFCKDLLSQSNYYVAQARKADRDECELREKRKKELEEFEIQRAIKKENESQILFFTDYEEEILLKCQELKEKTKNALIIKPNEPKSKEKHKHCESDSDGSVTSEAANGNINPGPSKSNKSKTRGGKKKNIKNGKSLNKKRTLSKEKHADKPRQQKLKIVSKAIITSSESDSTDDEVHNVIKKPKIVEQTYLDSRSESQSSDSSY